MAAGRTSNGFIDKLYFWKFFFFHVAFGSDLFFSSGYLFKFTESDDFLDSKELPTYDDVHSTIDYIAVHKNNLTSVNPQASVFLRKAMEQYLSRIIRCTIEFARSNRQDLLQSGNGDNGVRFPIQLSDFAHALEENSYLMGTNQSMFLEFVAIQSGMHSSDPEYRILDM